MARVGDNKKSDLIFAAVRDWQQRCLLEGKSLLWPEREVWSEANLERFRTCFIDNPDETKNKSFEAKLQEQLSGEVDDVTRLACELLYVYFLYPSESSVGANRKRELIREVAGWKGIELDGSASILEAFGSGIGNPGLAYNTGRPFELTYLARFVIRLLAIPLSERQALLNDHVRSRALLDELSEEHREQFGRSPQLRHILLFLLYPDRYERISSGAHKVRIRETFGEMLEGLAPDDVDECIGAIRSRLETLMPGRRLDFYWPPLVRCWYSAGEEETISPLQGLEIKKQIVLFGPPGTGKTYQARELAGTLIRQFLLKHWGPARYFSSEVEVTKAVEARVNRVQFHPGYGYEDFVRGLQLGAGGATEYRGGVLLNLVDMLRTESEEMRPVPFVLILDEMNRADLSRVLGECFSLLEDRDTKVQLAGHDTTPKLVQLPSNLHLIGTMNLIDQSLEHVDFALRRRFLWFLRGYSSADFMEVCEIRWAALRTAKKVNVAWERVAPEFEMLGARAKRLNEEIERNSYLGPQYQIGHTYFCDVVAFVSSYLGSSETKRQRVLFNAKGIALEPVESLWRYSIEPLLSQYLSGADAVERIPIIYEARTTLLGLKRS